VQDAHNLGWKLADVIRGHASEDLLASYSAERVPIGEKLLSSTKTATALVALKNIATPVVLPIGTGLLNAMKPVKRMVERKVQRTMSGLALDYTASPLTVAGDTTGTAPGCRVGCTAETEQRSIGWQQMCAEFTDPRWTLLGLPATEDDVATLKRVDSAYRSAISVRSIGEIGPHPLRDPDGALHRDLGLTAGMCAIVRPDGYLAAKGLVTRVDSLLDALHLLSGSRAVAK
jgi:NADPH-dependent dioxygenase